MIRIAVFGAGAIGSVHARNVAAHPDCELSHVVDPILSRAESLARAHGGVATTSIEDALDDSGVAAVVVASATVAHAEQVLACASAGKAILCEKPIGIGLDQARRCFEAAGRSGVAAATGFNRRLDSQYRSLWEQVRAGEIGRVEALHFASRTGVAPTPESASSSGGMIREKGAHFFDLACWLSGAEPVEVFAAGACLVDPAYAEFGDVDTAALTLRLESGALATFAFGRRSAFGQDEWIEVFGSGGMLTSGRTRSGDVSRFRGAEVVECGVFPGWYDRFARSYEVELDVLVSAVRKGTEVHATLADGLRAQAVAEAAIRSQAENAPVRIENVWS